ncbi:hypothetical protein P4O66_003872 [Electrophorus voltai]|uniref:Ig-like domain-containing protein n=1 Tax=Electrophorus voltai TaxID=2609070 RepID=A0AAD8ZRF2_9TELE|nr:hypothetical protein P4O66_003872 [Electrophorus voltai]
MFEIVAVLVNPREHCTIATGLPRATVDGMRRLDPVHFSMLVVGVSFACYAPSLDSLQEQAYQSAVVIEGEVRSLPENVSAEAYSVNVKVLDVWPSNSGGLEREQLVTVGEFGSEAPCVAVEKDHRYLFFMDPTEEPLVFKASYAPLETIEKNLKKDVESILCEDCASAPKVKAMRSQWVGEGDRVTLKCEAQGNPRPSFRWFKDGSELHKSKDIKIKTNKKNSKIQISRVRLEDSGNYTCVVENSLGKENSTSYVSVQSKPKLWLRTVKWPDVLPTHGACKILTGSWWLQAVCSRTVRKIIFSDDRNMTAIEPEDANQPTTLEGLRLDGRSQRTAYVFYPGTGFGRGSVCPADVVVTLREVSVTLPGQAAADWCLRAASRSPAVLGSRVG